MKAKESVKKCGTVSEIGHLGDTGVSEEYDEVISGEQEKYLNSDKPEKFG